MADSSQVSGGIVYVITSLAMGGAQNVLLQLLAGCPADYRPLCVVSLRRVEGVEDKVEALGIKVLHLELNKPWRLPVNLFRLWRYLRTHSVSLLLSIMPHANLFGVLLRLLSGGRWRLIWSLHNTPQAGLYPRWDHRLLLGLSCRAAQYFPEKIIVVSQRSRDRYIELNYPEDKLALIPNGMPVGEYNVEQQQVCSKRVRDVLGLPVNTALIGSLTRYVPEKNIPLMLEAFSLLLAQSPGDKAVPVHLLLAGENMDISNEALQALLIKFQLVRHVSLLGIRADAPELIRSLNIATLSSTSEALPLFMIEAMAAGIPCVATDVGDIAALFGDYGYLVKPNRPDLLAAAWRSVLDLSDEEVRHHTQSARQRVADEFGVQKMLDQYEAIYRSDIDRH